MISYYVEGVGEVVAKFDNLSTRMTEELRKSINRLTITLQKKVKGDKLSGQVLGVRSGRGRRSIQQDVTAQDARVTGVVSTNVFYMIGWETGWDVNGSKAAFSLSGGGFFKNGSPKKRPFLVPSLKEMEMSGEVRTELEAAAARATR